MQNPPAFFGVPCLLTVSARCTFAFSASAALGRCVIHTIVKATILGRVRQQRLLLSILELLYCSVHVVHFLFLLLNCFPRLFEPLIKFLIAIFVLFKHIVQFLLLFILFISCILVVLDFLKQLFLLGRQCVFHLFFEADFSGFFFGQ